MKESRYAPEEVAFGLLQAEEDTPVSEVCRKMGISTSHLSLIMRRLRTPSGDVLRRLREVLFRPTTVELVAPVELKVMT